MATITKIESQAFPQVMVSMAVFDENGPLDGLTTNNFQVFENDRQVPASAIAVESDTLQDLLLVLALDVSIPNRDSFAQVKEAAKNFVGVLGPGDRVAIISFAENVAPAHIFTNNHEELQAVIDDLTVETTYTASHQALAEAIAMLNEETEGRKAVMVVTDSRDNTGSTAIDEIIDQAQEARVPLYVIGFGDKVRSDRLIDKVGLTGGQYFVLSGADQVEATLSDLEALLRRGYKLTFWSGLEVNGGPQDLAVEVTDQDKKTQVEGSFVATSGQVMVTLAGVTEDQTVARLVSLSSQVTAPAPEVSVEYFLDDELLARVTESPYDFEWDSSTAPPGPHILAAKALDSAGNRGQAEVAVNVAQPVKVTLIPIQTKIELGEEVAIQARVETETDLARVDFLLDDVLLDSLNAFPYRFVLDSSEYPLGAHIIAVRVEDNLGQTAEDSFSMQFLPPSTEPVWAKRIRTWLGVDRPTFERWLELAGQIFVVVVALIAILTIVLMTFLLFRVIAKSQRRRSQRKYKIHLANVGNVHSRYQLQAEEGLGALKFQFAWQGMSLPQMAVSRTIKGMTPLATGYAVPEASAHAGPVTLPAPPGSPPPSQKGDRGVGQTMNKAKSAGRGARGCVMTIAEILGTLSQLLPGSAGRSVRGWSQRLSAGESAVRRTTYAPKRMARTAGQLQSQVGGITPATPRAEHTSRETRARSDTDIIAVKTRRSGTQNVATPHLVPDNGKQIIVSDWVETPVVEPGEMLNIDLLIDPVNPYRKQSYAFTVNSRSAEQAETTLLSEQGMAQIAGISWLRRFLPIVVISLLMAALILGIIYLTLWRLTGIDIFNWLIFV